MSDSCSSNTSDSDTEDDIFLCINELEKIVQETEEMLHRLEVIQRKIDGPSVTFQGKRKPVTQWLTEWEDEMKHDTAHNITWGQFLIEKLAQCNDAA